MICNSLPCSMYFQHLPTWFFQKVLCPEKPKSNVTCRHKYTYIPRIMPRLPRVPHTKKRNIWLLSLCVPWWKQAWTGFHQSHQTCFYVFTVHLYYHNFNQIWPDLTALQSGVNMSLSTNARPEPNDKRFDLIKHRINAWNCPPVLNAIIWYHLVAVATTVLPLQCSIPALNTPLHVITGL